MSEKISAKVSHRFQASSRQVYEAWLHPAKVRQWMAAALRGGGLAGDMQRVEIDPRVGGKFFFSDKRGDMEARHWGTYLELDPAHKIVFTWIVDESDEADPSRVTLTIELEATGCRATLEHEMDAKWSEYVALTEQGWARMLEQVENLCG